MRHASCNQSCRIHHGQLGLLQLPEAIRMQQNNITKHLDPFFKNLEFNALLAIDKEYKSAQHWLEQK
jgi:hypothetical protein